MKDYLLLFRVGPGFQSASPEQLQQITLRSKDWVAGIAKTGKLNGVVRLQRSGAVLKGPKKQLTEGPHTGAKDREIVNGYMSIKAESLDEAVEIAKGSPLFDYDGTLEVREVIVN